MEFIYQKIAIFKMKQIRRLVLVVIYLFMIIIFTYLKSYDCGEVLSLVDKFFEGGMVRFTYFTSVDFGEVLSLV